MIDDGVFREREPDAVFAQHVRPSLPVGQIGVRQKEMTGNSDRFEVVVEGTGGHASSPHPATDALLAANQAIKGLQSLISRNVSPPRSAGLTMDRERTRPES